MIFTNFKTPRFISPKATGQYPGIKSTLSANTSAHEAATGHNLLPFKPQSASTHRMRRGFTLIELSIMFVIIGLLIGGILVSQSMIKTSQVSRAVSDFQQIETMFRLFKDTYKQIPGDYNQANALFGGIDGNGDGLIHANATNQTREGCNVFHHLQEMGMLKNMGLLALQSHNSGVNGYIYETDACAILAAPFHRHYYKIARTTSGAVPGIYGNTNNFITIDAISSATDRWWDTGSIPTDDAAAIDLKIDDGVANSGIVYGEWNCTGGAAGATAGNGGNYLIGSINCQPIYFFTTW